MNYKRKTRTVGFANISETKIMSKRDDATPLCYDNDVIKVTKEYMYLCQKLTFRETTEGAEVNRRIESVWGAFGKLQKKVFCTKDPQYASL